jgi:ABC-type proline/glycine betaine transport system substrate-binding protein
VAPLLAAGGCIRSRCAVHLVPRLFSRCGKPVIKTYDGQWQSIRVNNAIVEFIIEQGYGDTVETVEMTSHERPEAMETGEINQVKLEAYGLTRYYNIFSSGSSAAMEAAFEGARMNHQPVISKFLYPMSAI